MRKINHTYYEIDHKEGNIIDVVGYLPSLDTHAMWRRAGHSKVLCLDGVPIDMHYKVGEKEAKRGCMVLSNGWKNHYFFMFKNINNAKDIK